jgi:hypothetical protein
MDDSRSKVSAGKATRRYFLWFAVPVAVGVLLIAFLNTWVNPLWLTPMPWSDPGFAEYKPIHKDPRPGKAGLAAIGPWDAILLGSSRVDIALDPTLPQWEGKRVANLALRGGTLNEHLAMLTYASSKQKLDLVILGVDLADVTNPVTIPEGSNFENSPLSPAKDQVERQLRYVSGISTFVHTVKCLNYRRQGRLGAYSAQGQWVRQLDKRPLREVLQRESFRSAERFILQRKESIEVKPAKTQALRDIIAFCREKGIRLILCIPPNHAAYLSAYRLEGDPDPSFRVDRDAFTKAIADEATAHPGSPTVDLWDFNDFHPYNCEPLPQEKEQKSKYWADGTHALPSLGNIMLARMLDWPIEDPLAATYGTKIDRSNLDDQIRRIEEGYEAYRVDHPEDFAWVKDKLENPVWK